MIDETNIQITIQAVFVLCMLIPRRTREFNRWEYFSCNVEGKTLSFFFQFSSLIKKAKVFQKQKNMALVLHPFTVCQKYFFLTHVSKGSGSLLAVGPWPVLMSPGCDSSRRRSILAQGNWQPRAVSVGTLHSVCHLKKTKSRLLMQGG